MIREDIKNTPEAGKVKVLKRHIHDYKCVFRNNDSLRQFASDWLVNLAEKFDDIRSILIPDDDGEVKDSNILFAAIELAKSGRDVDSVLEVCPANSQPVETALIKWAAIINAESSWQSSKTP
jgi:F0F1-type ATP synthase delta subunit